MRRFKYSILLALGILGLGLSATAHADYAWIPVHKKLVLRVGGDWNKSFENYDGDGYIADFSLSGKLAEIRQFDSYVFGEYGIAERWSMWMRLQYTDMVSNAQTTGDLLASGAGLGDTVIGFKRALTTSYPLFTAETYFKFPTGSTDVSSGVGGGTAIDASKLVVGDGNVDWVFRFHLGLRDGPVLFALSPSFLMRFGSYSPAAMLEVALQYNYMHAYGRVYAEGMLPLGEPQTSTGAVPTANQLENGTAGSFMKMAFSPSYFAMGVRAGFNFTKQTGIEAYVAMPFQGNRMARFLKFGANMIFNFDFYNGDYRPNLRDVPFVEFEDTSGQFD